VLSAAERAASISASHHDHKDDQGTGRNILWSLIMVVGISQAAVFAWKKYHPSSFNLMSLVAMWLFPAAWAVVQGELHPLKAPFFYMWLLFSLLMAALLAAVHQRTLAEATPGVVYGVLEQVYLQCMWVCSSVTTGIMILVMVPSLGSMIPAWALSLFFGAGLYAVYFAVLARDVTGVISDKLVERVRYVQEDASAAASSSACSPASGGRSSHSNCALCGGKLDIVDEGTVVEEGTEAALGSLHLSGRSYALRKADGSIVIIHPGMGSTHVPAPPAAKPSPSTLARLGISRGSASGGGSDASSGASAGAKEGEPQKTIRFESRDGKTIMFQLTCKHIFHRTCLAGWCVVGKKGECPCCKERVEMGVVYSHSPLIGQTSALFAHVIEFARYMVV